MTDNNMVNINVKDFKKIYNKSVAEGKESFFYKGREVLVSYAKYLIEYMDSKIKA